jgi:uncharacterized membrane protein YfcA
MIVTTLLFVAAAIGGALNAVAGGGSFLTLPSLIFDINAGRWLPILSAASLAGGLVGALLLVRTSDSSFLRLLPWLMLVAAATFTFGGRAVFLTGRTARAGASSRQLAVVAALQFTLAIYGGYFGGGMGIMMLAIFSVVGMTDIHAMNGLKAVLAVATNAVALGTFVVSGIVEWAPGLVMMAGAIAGGYAGAAVARRVDPRAIRGLVVAIGWVMTAYFFVR